MPHPDDIKCVRPELKCMTRDQLTARLEELSAVANKRMSESSFLVMGAFGGAAMQYMTAEELQEMHEIKLMLPTSRELAAEARERIQARLAARRAKRPVQS